MKKRYVILLSILLMIILGSVIPLTRPVLPHIQLPGEIYPGTEGIPVLHGLTNTFVATLVTYLIIVVVVLAVGARGRSAQEVPEGLYNFFEMVIEGAYNFAEGIAGSRVRDFFPYFMTFLLVIIIANWLELVPGVDSIGLYHELGHGEEGAVEGEEAVHLEEGAAEEPVGDLHVGPFLIRADGNLEGQGGFLSLDADPADAVYTIVPFLRAPATDLNFTLALALVSMFMVQYYGFKYLGLSYLSKFFTLPINEIAKNPIKALDPAVGILEFVSEVSKILSFSFRLLGNIFAGQVLLFVMAFLLPVANVAFFALEFFVGAIQAIVFAMLSLVFMAGAAVSHHGDEH